MAVVEAPAPVQPDQEEMQAITSELSMAKTRLAQAKILLALADVTIGPGSETALSLRYKGGGKTTPTKQWLHRDIELFEATVAALQGMYDDWQAREEAYLDGRTEGGDQ